MHQRGTGPFIPYVFAVYASAIALIFGMMRVARAAVVIDAIEAGSPTADDEYIRLRNTGDAAVDISAWSLQVKNDTATTIQKKNFSAGATIAPGATYIIANKNGAFAAQAQMTYSSLTLADGGGTAALVSSTAYINYFDDPIVVDYLHFEKVAGLAPQPPPSAVSSVHESITPVAQNNIVWPIRLNELFPHPTNGDEFIEIVNTSNEGVDVSGLWIRDASGNAYAFGSRNENTLLGAHEARAWMRSLTTIALNDTGGELVQLVDQSGVVIDQISYANDAPLDAAYAKFNNAWLWTTTPTPHNPNRLRMLPLPPIARADIPATPIRVGQTITVSAEDTTDPNDDLAALVWNFGDGFEATAVTTTHAFAHAGDYTIALTAYDARGASSTAERLVHVLAPTNDIASSTPIAQPNSLEKLHLPLTLTPSLTPRASTSTLSRAGSPNTTSARILAAHITPASHALKISAPTARVQSHYYSGTITVPLNILAGHRFIVDDRMIEITTPRDDLASAPRGTPITFSATKNLQGDTTVLRIGKNDLVKRGATVRPIMFTTIAGVVISVSTNAFDVAASSTDVFVLGATRYVNYTHVAVGDHVRVTGVPVRTDAAWMTLVTSAPDDIVLLEKNPTQPNQTTSASTGATTQNGNIWLLIMSGLVFFALHLLITRYGKDVQDQSKSWFEKLTQRLRIAYKTLYRRLITSLRMRRAHE